MQFGNWTISDKGISWTGNGTERFLIPAQTLTATREGTSGEFKLYDWIVVATEKEWLTENDLYDLNFAFVYAVAKFDGDFHYDYFDATLAYQFEIFEEEDDEE